jgi:membrane fusion protein (multidrug efflux system)
MTHGNATARRTLIVLCAASVVAILNAGCGKKTAPAAPPPPTAQFVTIHGQAVTLTTDLPGRTVAYRTAQIRPQVSGIVQKRMFEEGSDVAVDQQLYQIDPALYRATLASAQATAASSAALVERYRPLAEAQAVSRQDFDNAVATAAQNKAATETARINLVYTRLLSPIAGRIGRSSVTEGALVTAGQAVALATVQQLDPIYVDAPQPSSVLLRLKREFAAGQLQQAGDNQAEVHLTLEDGTEYAHAGRLQFSEVSVDADTGSVTLRAVFPNPDRLLLPGAFVHERLVEGQSPAALLVPQQAVTRGPTGDPTALVIGPDNKVESRKLTTGRAIGDQWLVTSGLQDGDRVVIQAQLGAKPGSPVQPEEFTPPLPRAASAPNAAAATASASQTGPAKPTQ